MLEVALRLDAFLSGSPESTGAPDFLMDGSWEDLSEQQQAQIDRLRHALEFLNQLPPEPDGDADRDDTRAGLSPDGATTRIREGEASRESRIEKTPSQIGKFRLIDLLGEGGFARVFLARDAELDRLVALKLLKPAMLISADSQARFEREARLAAMLSHPNVVPVFESGQFGVVRFIVSEYCDGPDLAAWFGQRERQIPVAQAVEIVIQLADAIQHAHQRGVLHRDLKPSNVMLQTGDGDAGSVQAARITDFGLARAELADSEQMTLDGAIVGTPAYMAPEQAAGESDTGPTTDIYSLGVILYELLTGRLPHQAETPLKLLRKVETEVPVEPRRIRNDIPADVQAICLKAMAKRPEHRYRTAHELAEDLRRWQRGSTVTARNPGAVEKARRWVARNPRLATASFAAIGILVIGLAATTTQWLRAEQNLEVATEQRQRAERHLDRIESALDEIVIDAARQFGNSESDRQARNRILGKALKLQEELIDDEPDSPLVRLRTGQAHLRLASLLALQDEAELASKHIDEALRLLDDPDASLDKLVDAKWSLANW